MIESTLSAQGRTTVPAAIRARVGAGPGSRLVWHVLPNGVLLVRAKTGRVLELAATVQAPEGRTASIDEMNAWR